MDRRAPPLFSTKFSLLLGVCLIVPYVFKSVTRVEPFPAMIFPEGIGKIRVAEGVAEFNHLALLGYRADGRAEALNPVQFLAPIPVQYLRAITSRNFGLVAAKDRRQGLLSALNANREPRDPRVLAEVRHWLEFRLSSAGLGTRRLLVRSDTIRVEMRTGRELSRTTLEEKVVPLD